MNYKTTVVLILLVAAAGSAGYYFHFREVKETASPSAEFLEKELTPEALTLIKVKRGGNSFVLERKSAGEEWALPGKWPARDVEVRELVKTITSIRPRFEPFPLEDKKAILDKNPLVLKLLVAGKEHTITMAEEPGGANPFVRPTYARIDDFDEVLRLAPGLLASLDHDQEFFRKRRLFDKERPAGDDPPSKVDQVAATGIFITRMNPDKTNQLICWSAALVGTAMSPGGYGPLFSACASLEEIPKDASYRLVKVGEDWEMIEPARDRIDPAKAKVLLAGLANMWAETFVGKDRTPDKLGLTMPYMTIKVTRPSGTNLEVQVGDVASSRMRFEERDGPPNKFGMPQKMKVPVKEETRFARLKDHDLFFEINLEKLDDNVVPLDPNTLRDLRLARFQTGDARRLEIKQDGQTLVLVKTGDKGKETWNFAQTGQEAEESAVENLLRELSDLRIQTVRDIIDSTDDGKFGLDKPAGIVKVRVEESKKGEPETLGEPRASAPGADDKKKKVERNFTFRLGSAADAKGKVFVMVDGWPRINRLPDDDLLKLVQAKPSLALAFRKRQLLDVKTDDLARVDVQQGKGSFALKRSENAWQLAEPVKAELDAKKLGAFPDDLAQLRAVEFVAETPSADDLDKIYGLANPSLKATIHFSAAGKPAQTLIVGKLKEEKKEEGKKADMPKEDKGQKEDGKKEDKPGLYYARLDQGPIFLMRKELHDELSRDSVAYRTDVLWKVNPAEIAQISIQKAGSEEFRLQRDGEAWKVLAPFTASASAPLVDNLAQQLADLKIGTYVANQAKDLAPFGLDKQPFLQVKIVLASVDTKGEKTKISEYALSIGKEMAGGRYARLEGSDSVFAVNDARAISMLEMPVYELLDRSLLKAEIASIESIRVKGKTKETTFSLEKKKDAWQVTDSPAPAFMPAEDARDEFLQTFTRLQAQKIVERGPKIDWVKYGLDNPPATITIAIRKGDKTQTHTLALGGDAGLDQRYARWDDNPAVVVLGQVVLRELNRGYLDFVNVSPLRFPVAAVTGFTRKMPGGDLEVKKSAAWNLLNPQRVADLNTVKSILQMTADLRFQRVAAYPVADLAKFGLEKPAVFTLKLEGPDGKPTEHVIKLGAQSERGPAEGHYAVIDKGEAVVVLEPELSKLLLAKTVNFSDHNLSSFAAAGVDEVALERVTGLSARRVVFKLVDGTWKMTEPPVGGAGGAPAEAQELANLIRTLARLRAEEIVADKIDAKDLKEYGLDRPKVECRLSGQGKILLEIALGGAVKSDAKDKSPRHFARLLGKDRPLVFVLGPEISTELQEEYRSRKPWSEFDAAEVEKIQVTAGPGKSFTLVNVGKGWLIQDRLDLKVDPKLVAETLDALARLETPRYVADAKANLQLYGLVPPAFKVELELPTGKRALLIGRAEGTSQSYYASVAGSDSVFLLSPADARRILRGAAAYAIENKEALK